VDGSKDSPFHIPSKILKEFKACLSVPLALYFTMLFTICKFPSGFKASVITPLYKGKGPKSSADSYRPIVNLPLIGKIFEKIIYFRLYKAVETQLNPHQHGFRSNRSCETAVAELTQYIFDNVDKRCGRVVCVFIDLKKAFNSIDHNTLIAKLISNLSLTS